MKPTLAAAIIFALTPLALAAQSSMPGMSMPAKPPVAPSTSLTITFNGSTTTFSIADLKALPQQTILHSYVTATGTDGYFVIYSAAELEPMFTSGKVIVALTADGSPDTSGLQLVNPLDVKPARWVHGLTSLTVSTLPQSE